LHGLRERKLHMTPEPHRDKLKDGAQFARRIEWRSSVLYMDCLFSVLADSDETDGRFGLMEMVAPRGREPSRHLHHTDERTSTCSMATSRFTLGRKCTGPVPVRSFSCLMAYPTPIPSRPTWSACSASSAPGGFEAHFRHARFSGPAPTLTLPSVAGDPDTAIIREMARDLADYGTEVVCPPGPPQQE
jgi:hypothetical protein